MEKRNNQSQKKKEMAGDIPYQMLGNVYFYISKTYFNNLTFC